MVNHHETKDTDLSNSKAKNQLFLPIIALAFTFTPTLLLLLSFIPSVGIVFMYLFASSFWGAGFHVIGVFIGTFYLATQVFSALSKKRINIKGVICTIISILIPIVRWTIIISLYQKGTLELFL